MQTQAGEFFVLFSIFSKIEFRDCSILSKDENHFTIWSGGSYDGTAAFVDVRNDSVL